ncbi:MAG: hypothetical protein JXR26_01620 [Balneolaceae bacterium]|nr:hypothetical protein [Balneolaceae bacterium]
MKQFYSAILLISFLVGTLQPILPMIEYQWQGGDIIELLGFAGDGSEAACPVVDGMITDCEPAENDQQLLDIDYYPLALEISSNPEPQIFLSSTRFYLPYAKHIVNPAFYPNPPPPRLS